LGESIKTKRNFRNFMGNSTADLLENLRKTTLRVKKYLGDIKFKVLDLDLETAGDSPEIAIYHIVYSPITIK
jgi:hypothetical protein